MNYFRIDPEAFNPQVYYVSYEYYTNSNNMQEHMHAFPTVMFVDKVEGACAYVIDGKTYDISVGDIFFINPGIYHHKTLSSGAEICEAHLAFDGVKAEGFPENHVVYPETHARVRLGGDQRPFYGHCVAILKDVIDNPRTDAALGAVCARALMMQLFAIALESARRDLPIAARGGAQFVYQGGTHDQVAFALREYLIENYTKDVSLSAIVGKIYLSQEYLIRIFRAEIGVSPYRFLTELRLNKAKELLENGDAPIAHIASSVGYADAYHFSKLFKKYFSVSPRDYRKQFRAEGGAE